MKSFITSICYICSSVMVACSAGCMDLPDNNYPLLPTPDDKVVSRDNGRGSYNWQLDKGKFWVTRPFESTIFQQVNQERVQRLMAEAIKNPRAPEYVPPAWVDMDLRLTIQACLNPGHIAPSHRLALPLEPLDKVAAQQVRLALNKDGSRLLVVRDKLTLWDTSTGQLLKEQSLPIPVVTHAFLTPTGDEAYLFGPREGLHVALHHSQSESTDKSASFTQDVLHVVASGQRQMFVVQTEGELIGLNANLQAQSSPGLAPDEQAFMAIADKTQELAVLDGGVVNLVDLSKRNPPNSLRLPNKTKPRGLVASQSPRLYAAFEDCILDVSLDKMSALANSLMVASHLAGCQTRLSIEGVYPLEPTKHLGGSQLTICVRSPFAGTASTAGPTSEQYGLIDIDLLAQTSSLPTILGSQLPAQMELSGNGQVCVTAVVNQPIEVHFRAPGLVQNTESDGLVQRIAELILQQRSTEAEQLTESLEAYAASAPYTFQTRRLLDLKSSVAKVLAKPTQSALASDQSGITQLMPAVMESSTRAIYGQSGYGQSTTPTVGWKLDPRLDEWIKAGSLLARLVRVTHQANREFSPQDNQAWQQNQQEVLKQIQEIMASDRPPELAFEILANLTPLMHLDPESLSDSFAFQFERDPLNPQLHLCMTGFYLPERAGDVGQSVAYLAQVSSYLPVDQRDPFYSLYGMQVQQAVWSNQGGSRNLLPQVYNLYGTPLANRSNMVVYNPSRMRRGLQVLIEEPNSIWSSQFSRSLWSQLLRILPAEELRASADALAKRYLERFLFCFGDEFTTNSWMTEALQKQLTRPH